MKKIVCSIILLVLSSNVVFAMWAHIELDELVGEADLIVVGTLHQAEENYDGIGKGYISVDEVVSGKARTIDGRPLTVGDSLKIIWADNWACAAGMHMGRRGKQGVWLLDVEKDGTVSAAYPGKFESLESLTEIRKLLRKNKKRPAAVTVDTNTAPMKLPPELHAEVAELTDIVVDVSPWPDYSLERAAATILLAFGLYILLYRSRFRVR